MAPLRRQQRRSGQNLCATTIRGFRLRIGLDHNLSSRRQMQTRMLRDHIHFSLRLCAPSDATVSRALACSDPLVGSYVTPITKMRKSRLRGRRCVTGKRAGRIARREAPPGGAQRSPETDGSFLRAEGVGPPRAPCCAHASPGRYLVSSYRPGLAWAQQGARGGPTPSPEGSYHPFRAALCPPGGALAAQSFQLFCL